MSYLSICNVTNGCGYVEQGQAIISEKILRTCCLGTCSVLCFTLLGKNFLSHIDSMAIDEKYLINLIKKYYSNDDLINNNYDIYIVYGSWCNNLCRSIQIAQNVIKYFKLKNKVKIIKNIEWLNEIIISSKGLVIN